MHLRTSNQGKGKSLQLQQLLHQISLQTSLQRKTRVRRERLLSHQEAAVTTQPTQSWAFLPCLPQCHKVPSPPLQHHQNTHFRQQFSHVEGFSHSSLTILMQQFEIDVGQIKCQTAARSACK